MVPLTKLLISFDSSNLGLIPLKCSLVGCLGAWGMVFMARLRGFKALDEDEEKMRKKPEIASMGRLDRVKFCLFVSLMLLISGFLVVWTSQALKGFLSVNSTPRWQRTRLMPLHAHREGISAQGLNENKAVIRDLVIFPDEILLFLVLPEGHLLPRKEDLTCVFGARSSTKVLGVAHVPRRSVAVRCEKPREGLGELRRGVALDQVSGAESVLIEMPILPNQFMKWNRLVFEILPTPEDVVLLAKGIAKKQGQNLTTRDLKCVFDDAMETPVTSASQEVFRCEHPPLPMREKLSGKKVTLNFEGKNLPSVVYYESDTVAKLPEGSEDTKRGVGGTQTLEKKYFLCSCTMIFNGAKFLKEWVVYHAHLGVESFFLYDNNSEDKLEDAVQELSSYNVTRHPWPWVKTQEAGFSYCATEAQPQCTWMIFTDVDEFLFPRYLISPVSHGSRARITDVGKSASDSHFLTTLIKGTVKEVALNSSSSSIKKVGQISFHCLDFGPSGLKQHPREGVMQGYTCRLSKNQRHKSVVFLGAISRTLLNVVHHFSLQPGYKTVVLPQEKAVINHYKYQAWDEFKGKFRRRVSAFVADWKESKNLKSKDRTPGLGREDVKPPDWEHMFCEVNDTALRDYTRDAFGPVISWQ